MTYDGIFEKCKNIKELHDRYNELKNDPLADVGSPDCIRAYHDRYKELRNQRDVKEHSYA